uniref:chromatin remodeling protein EBS-like n=1 Tax=Erigeron canadensis TaxID=72917 RepID=UPI001CB942AB|nr:chromatin remodeling protein EBS-like [Erigeron canadensis]
MATHRNVRRTLGSYQVNRINTTIRPGDCVLMGPPDLNTPPYVAKIVTIQSLDNNVEVKVRWYYRPEETKGGRTPYHGVNEVFLSDHFDTQSVHSIVGTCTVHSYLSYIRRGVVDHNKDFFSRFKYFPTTGKFDPDRARVYCICEMPYNPDFLMIECEDCNDWYHPDCIGMSVDEAKQLDHFICQICVAKRSTILHIRHAAISRND